MFKVTEIQELELILEGVKYIWCRWRLSGVFIVNFEHISHLALVFLLLTLRGKCRLGSFCNLLSLISPLNQISRNFSICNKSTKDLYIVCSIWLTLSTNSADIGIFDAFSISFMGNNRTGEPLAHYIRENCSLCRKNSCQNVAVQRGVNYHDSSEKYIVFLQF